MQIGTDKPWGRIAFGICCVFIACTVAAPCIFQQQRWTVVLRRRFRANDSANRRLFIASEAGRPPPSLRLHLRPAALLPAAACVFQFRDTTQTSGVCSDMVYSVATGRVLQFHYADRNLECVFQLHNGPIHSIGITEGFCVTCSQVLACVRAGSAPQCRSVCSCAHVPVLLASAYACRLCDFNSLCVQFMPLFQRVHVPVLHRMGSCECGRSTSPTSSWRPSMRALYTLVSSPSRTHD